MRSCVATCLLLAAVRADPKVTMIVNAVGGGGMFVAGDAIAQRLEQLGTRAEDAPKRNPTKLRRALLQLPLSPSRLGQACAVGAVWGGVLIPSVYNTAERLFPGRAGANLLFKICFSVSCLSTAGNYAALVLRRTLADGINYPSLERAVASSNADIVGVVKADLKVWPLYDLFCFGLIPAHARPACTAVVSVMWHTYMSTVAHRAPISGTALACAI